MPKGLESSKDFFLFNNFVTGNSPFGQFVPSQSAAKKVNSLDFARPLCHACEKTHSTPMNLISVDFWNSGNIPELVQQHNEMLLAPGSTRCPTGMPSNAPSLTPTETPSSPPSLEPTSNPSEFPTRNPSSMPSAVPSATPSSSPSQRPTSQPTSTFKPSVTSINWNSRTSSGNYTTISSKKQKLVSNSAEAESMEPAARVFSVLLKVMFILAGTVGLVSHN